MVFGGDVSFDQEIRTIEYLNVYRLKKEQDKIEDCHPNYPSWQSSSLLKRSRKRIVHKLLKIYNAVKIQTKGIPLFEEFIANVKENENRRYVDSFARTAKRFRINYPTDQPTEDYPFTKIKSFFKSKDFVLVNLETPLASDCRIYGYFMSRPEYANAMANANISMVNLANNHIFDGGETGFLQTIENLKKAGILYTGAGDNFKNARNGASVKIKETNFIILGYTQYCNSRFASIAKDYPGILPLDVELMIEDIITAKKRADIVLVMLHWGIENQARTHPRAIEIAHSLIDAGADGIIGHHPHVPQEIEVYKNRPIFYSLGNLIHGHYREFLWSDNCLAEFEISKKRIVKIIIYPVSGKNNELFQPYLLTGERAQKVLKETKRKSEMFDTCISIKNDQGIIEL
jgi:poly-gamma-glutamate capsule biosynthesis protein CapA/YwtB (metallophosphatase superfamily)